MVHRVLEYFENLSANDTDNEIGRKSPREGMQWNVEEIWFRNSTDLEYTVSLRERDLILDMDGENAPTEAERLVVNWTVTFGEDLVVFGTEESGAAQDARMLALVDEVPAQG